MTSSLSRRQGFALPAVLTVTGVVTLIFLVAITALGSLNGEARSARERMQFLERALTAEATLQYLAATEPFSSQGLNPGSARLLPFGEEGPGGPAILTSGPVVTVFLDGRPYELSGGNGDSHTVRLALRDQAGMINLARLDSDQLRRLGQMTGLPAALSNNLRSLYIDYTDYDDLETLSGAEGLLYQGTEPANRPMLRPAEFLSIAGLRQFIDSRRWRTVRDDVAVDHQRVAINVNTATPRTLQILFGLTEQQAQSAVRAREASPFLSLSDFIAASGASVVDDGEQLYNFPAGRIIYTIHDTRSAWRYRARLILTPSSTERPFWVDQSEMTEASGTAMGSGDADRFPYTPR